MEVPELKEDKSMHTESSHHETGKFNEKWHIPTHFLLKFLDCQENENIL